MGKTEDLKISSFTLESSTQVNEVVNKIKALAQKQSLIHLISYIHNTPLSP